MANSLDMLPDSAIDYMIEQQEKGKDDGVIKFPLNVFTDGEWLGSTEILDALKNAKPEADEEEKAPKLQTLATGFMFTADKAVAGNHPFYLEAHLIGENQYAFSANKNGVLTRADVKALRKALKSLLNQEKEEFDISANPCAEVYPYDDSMNDSYYEDSEY